MRKRRLLSIFFAQIQVCCVVLVVAILAYPQSTVQALGGGGKIIYNQIGSGEKGPTVSLNPDGSEKVTLADDTTYSVASKDGSKVAYAKATSDGTSIDGIYVVNGDGSGESKLIDGEAVPNAISPDNTKIIYHTADDTVKVASLDSSEQIDLNLSMDIEQSLRFTIDMWWSPDGSKIIYNMMVNNVPQVFIMNSDGSDKSQLTSAVGMYPQFSANGQKIYYVHKDSWEATAVSLYSMNTDGSAKTQLNQLFVGAGAGPPTGLFVSASGQRYVFSKFDADEISHDSPTDVYSGTVGSGLPQKIFDDVFGGPFLRFCWSPDSSKVAYFKLFEEGIDIYISNVDGSGEVNVTNTPNENEVFFGAGTYGWSSPPIDNSSQNSIDNSVDGKAVIIDTPSGSTLSNFTAVNPRTIPADNKNVTYNYPMGLVNFTLSNINPGGEAEVTVFFETSLKSDQVVARKYFPDGKNYSDVPGVNIREASKNSKNGLSVTYQITDGGDLDIDGVADGSITDPVGLAIEDTGSLANTGALVGVGVVIGILMITVAIYTYFDYLKHKRPLQGIDPYTASSYSYWHHLKMVTVPLIKYRLTIRLEQKQTLPQQNL